jgi:DNA-directed RNA polymerase specialized sigma24 family protein
MMDHAPQIEPLYVFAVFMLGSRAAAFTAVCDVMGAHEGEPAAWLPALVDRLIAAEKAARVDRFAQLNDILRTNTTIPIDLSHPLVQGDTRRLNTLLWELQRSCLITTLRGISAERRAVFILIHVLGMTRERAAEVCGSSPSAVRVTETRARLDLAGYLEPRCEHLDAGNPCRCSSRLGNALEAGLVRWPEYDDYEGTHFVPQVQRDVCRLYETLPRVRLPIAK